MEKKVRCVNDCSSNSGNYPVNLGTLSVISDKLKHNVMSKRYIEIHRIVYVYLENVIHSGLNKRNT